MRKSIIENEMLPETEGEYVHLRERGNLKFMKCVDCNQPFHHSNVFTPAGWSETQISGICESCFDGIFKDNE